jgi:hypothetical protein
MSDEFVEIFGEGVVVVNDGRLDGLSESALMISDEREIDLRREGTCFSKEALLSGYPWMRTKG